MKSAVSALPMPHVLGEPWGTPPGSADAVNRRPNERPGRRPSLPLAVVERIRNERAADKSLGQIAADLNADRVPTAHGGVRWWPSTVRAVLRCSPSDAAPLPFSP